MAMDASSEQDDDDMYWSEVMEKYRSTKLRHTLNQLNAVFVGRELVILTDLSNPDGGYGRVSTKVFQICNPLSAVLSMPF